MAINLKKSRQYLQDFEFSSLFIEELGWSNPPSRGAIAFKCDGKTFYRKGVAELAGVLILEVTTEDGEIPDAKVRANVHKEICKVALENLVIFLDGDRQKSLWYWVKREGTKQYRRDHSYNKGQSGDLLLGKLRALAVELKDWDKGIVVGDATKRLKDSFDIDRVTKKFYEFFKKEHDLFLKEVLGFASEFDRAWYASLMLNRLMFVYFMQKKGFLDGNVNYLRDRLALCKQQGEDQFHSFYRYFLLRLFHEGLGKQGRSPELEKLLGKVPYLNGGLFEVHPLEQANPDIQIEDQAFEKIFNFFDGYDWALDDRPLRSDKEINPDVLGYIFEKYINQKQMGAYYTKEDITEYISKNCIIPFVFNAVEQVEGFGDIWQLLKKNPDRYIYDAVLKGVDIDLPEDIAAGIGNVSKRDGWNRAAGGEYALPTETWREHIARRDRCLEVRQKLRSGEVTQINDLITYNLNIRKFAEDAIAGCANPELLLAFYQTISQVSVLDPTCGSGAFLFAALNILEPLYDACLNRMQWFGGKQFEQILAKIADHPNRRYFILKSITINNLYGVDIMEEATEICKLRLFLKLVSQVEADPKKSNFGLEPLPDIDFNIRAGNTLVGFVSLNQVCESIAKDASGQRKLIFDDGVLERIIKGAVAADQEFKRFRSLQTQGEVNGEDLAWSKSSVKEHLAVLREELDRFLAEEYEQGLSKKSEAYGKWKLSHQPFHWFVEFYGIINAGGFDVIIGNPPYIEYSKVRDSYKLLNNFTDYSTNLYSACCYRSTTIKRKEGFSSFIVPVSLPSTDRMQCLRLLLSDEHDIYQVSFSTRPSKLFEGAEQRLTIYIQSPSEYPKIYSGGFLKWYKEERSHLFSCFDFVTTVSLVKRNHIWLKIKGCHEKEILTKMLQFKSLSESQLLGDDESLYYKNTGIRYFSTVTLRSPRCWINGIPSSSSRETTLGIKANFKNMIHSFLLSSTFFLHYQATSNGRDLNPSDIHLAPIPKLVQEKNVLDELSMLIEDDYTAKAKIVRMQNKLTGLVELESLTPSRSKPIIDEIDRVLAKHYGFTEEELDFIINYDIKYRMGKNSEEEE